ncbi:MAG: pantoate--beta-alanine ligase [Planctomycetales bacterium]|nr:pantoate--beta-alanine ligase [Planctomycetales bacterium]
MPPSSTSRPPLLPSAEEMRLAITAARQEGRSIGIVPTMGALHAGHFSLVEASLATCDLTVVTIFVNPTQFGEGEDFGSYPRDLEGDRARLGELAGDLVIFAPSLEAMYPPDHDTQVIVGQVAQPWEGSCRPGHFAGVATIVLKLFQLVPADVAFFGQKDYQQTLVIRRMVTDLHVPIRLEICPTVRDADGLALSSRNQYLSAQQRQQALSLSQSLRLAADLVATGQLDAQVIVRRMRECIQQAGDVQIDYVALADPETLQPVMRLDGPVVALVAARIGPARLIDNAILERR